MDLKLYDHQQEVLNETLDKNKVAYYLDMGLGKTYVGSEKLKSLHAPFNLVVCQKSKMKDWASHFRDNYDYEVVVFKNQEIESIKPNSIIIINYDLLWRRKQLQHLNNFTLLLDESQYIKNESSRRAEFVLGLKPDNVILLSGTPVGGKYEELWSQVRLLGWGISKELFYKQYTITEKRSLGSININVIKGYKNVDRLKEKLRSYGCVFMKTEEVLQLPNQVETTVSVANTSKYKRFIKEGAFGIDGDELTADTPLTQLLSLRKLASIYNGNKQGAFKDLLESTNERVVVFYNFNKEFEILNNICQELNRPVSYINGQGSNLESYDNEDNSITLVQYQAGASGMNLQKACRVIYFSLPLSCDLWMQSKKRVHRIGQQSTCFYYYLITENSVEERIFKVLNNRKDFTVELFHSEK